MFEESIAQTDHTVNSTCLSPALQAANARLLRLRAECPSRPTAYETQLSPDPAPASGHLSALVHGLSATEASPETAVSSIVVSSADECVPMYTSLALSILRNKAAAVGRVWALLHHHFNRSGRQVVPEREIVELVSSAGSPYRLFTARQWRNVKRLGDGVFWSRAGRDAGLLIHGTRQVAVELGIGRLEVGRVDVPISNLTKSTKSAKAAFYACFDASRQSMPISRAAKEVETGLTRVNQWRLEKGGLIDAQTNYELVTEKSNRAAVESAVFRFGSACFEFTDKLGKQGRAGEIYLARQMPNTYRSTLGTATNGRRKKINQRLKSHVTIGARGERLESDFARLYFDCGREALKAAGEGRERVSYRAQVQSQFGFWRGINDGK